MRILKFILLPLSSILLFSCDIKTKNNQTALEKSKEIRIPFILDENTQLIKVRINNEEKPVYFIFDTGSEITGINKRYSKSINLSFDSTSIVEGTGAANEYRLSSKNKITISENVVLNNERLTEIDMGMRSETYSGHSIEGIIGAAITSKYSLEMDFDSSRIILRPLGSQVPQDYTSSIPFTHTGDYFPRINASITLNNGDTISGPVYFDSGAQMGFLLNSRFAYENSVLSNSGTYLERKSFGIGDVGYNYVVRTQGMCIDTMDIPPFVMDISLSQRGVSAEKGSMGLLGMEIIKRFNFVLDFSKNKLYYRANNNAQKVPWFPVGGLILRQQNGSIYIDGFALGPSEEEDIQIGDEITFVNGKKVTSSSETQLQFFMAKPHTTFNLKIRRDKGEEVDRKFTVRPML